MIPHVSFLEIDKIWACVFNILLRFLKNLLESETLLCSATSGTKTSLGIIQLSFNYFVAFFSRYFAYTFPERLRRELPMYLVHSLLSPFCAWAWSTQFDNVSVPIQNTRPPDKNKAAKELLLDPRLWAFQVGSRQSLQPTQPSVFLQQETLAAALVHSSSKCTSFVLGGVTVVFPIRGKI